MFGWNKTLVLPPGIYKSPWAVLYFETITTEKFIISQELLLKQEKERAGGTLLGERQGWIRIFMVQNIDDTITHEAMCFLAPSYLSSLTQLCSPVIHWGPAILAFFLALQSLTPTLSRTCPHPIFFAENATSYPLFSPDQLSVIL